MDLNVIILVLCFFLVLTNLVVVIYCNWKSGKNMIELVQIIYNRYPIDKKEADSKRHVSLADKQRKKADQLRHE